MRIAYVCHYFPPEPAAPAARVHELSRAWVESGEQVTVLTGLPNHPTGIIPPAYQGRLGAVEWLDGIRVLRSWVYAVPNRGVSERGANHLSFMMTLLLFGLPRLGQVDLVLASSPTLFSAAAAWLMAGIKRVPFVLEVRDLWPDAFAEVGVMREGVVLRALRALAAFLYQQAALVVVVTHGFATRLAEQGVPVSKLAVIPNGADLSVFRPQTDGTPMRRRLAIPSDAFVVGYIGTHGLSHGLSAVLDAASLDPGSVYLLVGDGAARDRLLRERDERGLANVRMFPSVPKEQVAAVYAAADVCLVTLRDLPIFSTFIPSKMFELMAAARPIIGAVRGEAGVILRASGGAVVVDPEDGQAIAHASAELRADAPRRKEMGARGRRFVEANYDRRELAERYLHLLRLVVARN